MAKIKQFVTFYVNENFFGIDIRVVNEVNPNVNIISVPLSDPHITGLVNIRGQVVLVMDIKTIFNNKKSVITDKSHIIILKTKDELSRSMNLNGDFQFEKYSDKLCAALVDMIGEVVAVSDDEIAEPTRYTGQFDRKFISGVVQLKDKLLIILNPAELLWRQEDELEPSKI